MHRPRLLSFAAAAVCACLLATAAPALADVLRVANWNVGNLPNDAADAANLATVLGHIGTGHGGALDLMALAETDTTSINDTLAAFESAYGSGYGAVSSAADTGGDRTGFVFNADVLSLVSTSTVAGMTHPALRGQFRPVGTSGEADVWVYAVHLKSGTTSADEDERLAEAQLLRANADALGAGALVLYLGDFNWTGVDERGGNPIQSAWDVFNAAGAGRAIDPVNAAGEWRDNASYLQWHTQDPGAAMDDRFDMQLASEEFFDGEGWEYVSGSYAVVGNNGTHTLNGAISTGTGAPAGVLSALEGFSDHLPVVARYTLVPEPGGVALVLGGALILGLRRRHPSLRPTRSVRVLVVECA